MDRWLESLQKLTRETQPPKEQVNVSSQFRDLCRVDGGDSLDGDEVLPVYDNDPVGSDVHEPATARIAKFQEDRLNKGVTTVDDMDAPAGVSLEKRDKREIFFEKRSTGPGCIRFEVMEIDGQHWRYGYNHTGEVVNVRILLPEVA